MSSPLRRAPMYRREPLFSAIVQTFETFFQSQVAGGIVLVVTTIIALAWANSPYSEGYHHFWHTPIAISIGPYNIANSLAHWINDGLMAVFFLAVGLEIKHEIFLGKLSTIRKAALPVAGAIGGMVFPALIYVFFNANGEAAPGWGIPMATDIAFSLGAIALLGSAVPSGIRVFVAALAIADDLGAVLVIALFYTKDVSTDALLAAAILILILYALNRAKVNAIRWYLLVGFFLWLAVLSSGIHATVAGVIVGMLIPHNARWTPEDFLQSLERVTQRMRAVLTDGLGDVKGDEEERVAAVHSIEKAAERVQSPLHRLEHSLTRTVAFFIVPLFALANAGVTIDASRFGGYVDDPVFLGIILGLIVGKPLGITLIAFLAVKSKLAELPHAVYWRHIFGSAVLCGIGFTMSLFIGELALGNQAALFQEAKLAILIASIIAGVAGFFYLKLSSRAHRQHPS